MLVCFLTALLALAKVQSVSSLTQNYGKIIEGEFLFGLRQFQNTVDTSVANLAETEINFMSEGINLMVFYGENLTFQAQLLFENYGFVVDQKQLYEFVGNVRKQIKTWITQLIDKSSANQIKKKLLDIFRCYLLSLKKVFETEVGKICRALERNEIVIECWKAYKVPILKLGFDVITDLESLTLNEAKRLTILFDELTHDVSFDLNQIIADLSLSGSKRLIVNTYIEANQKKILDKVDTWFQRIAISLRETTERIQRGVGTSIADAKHRIEVLSRKISDCIQG